MIEELIIRCTMYW